MLKEFIDIEGTYIYQNFVWSSLSPLGEFRIGLDELNQGSYMCMAMQGLAGEISQDTHQPYERGTVTTCELVQKKKP